jgi:hypothetical protein
MPVRSSFEQRSSRRAATLRRARLGPPSVRTNGTCTRTQRLETNGAHGRPADSQRREAAVRAGSSAEGEVACWCATQASHMRLRAALLAPATRSACVRDADSGAGSGSGSAIAVLAGGSRRTHF